MLLRRTKTARAGLTVPRLEIHVAHACNLTCESCAHFSNSGHSGVVSVASLDEQMSLWSPRVRPQTFRLLGGEPTLHPELPRVVRLARERWPGSTVQLVTNGFFLDRHPGLPAALEETRTELHLTEHHDAPDYRARFAQFQALVAAWKERHHFRLYVEHSDRRWTRRHRGVGAEVLPYEDGRPRHSWERCVCRGCKQIFEGRIYKCPPLAYLRLQKRRYPGLSPSWDPYLAYRPLEATASDADVAAFFAAEDEPACAMCPSVPERFDKPSPLLRRGPVSAP